MPQLGRPRRRWVDNIRMDLQEVGCGYMDWIRLAQDRDSWWTLVSAVMNLLVPWNAGNLLTSCKPVNFSRRTLHHAVSKCCIPKTNNLYPFLGGGEVDWRTAVQVGRSRNRFLMGSLELFIYIILGIDSASNRNEYQDYFLGGKGGRCVRLTNLPLYCADCHEIWEPVPPWNPHGLSSDCFISLIGYYYM